MKSFFLTFTLVFTGFQFAHSQINIGGQTYTCSGSLVCNNNTCTCNGQPLDGGSAQGGPCLGEEVVAHSNGGGAVSTRAEVDERTYVSLDSAVCGTAKVIGSRLDQQSTVNGKAEVMGAVLVRSSVNGRSLVTNAQLTNTTVNGSAKFRDSRAQNSTINGNVQVGVNSQVTNSTINGNSQVFQSRISNSVINGNRRVENQNVSNEILN